MVLAKDYLQLMDYFLEICFIVLYNEILIENRCIFLDNFFG